MLLVATQPNIQINTSTMVKSICEDKINISCKNNLSTCSYPYDKNSDIILWTGGVRFCGYGQTTLYKTLNNLAPTNNKIKPRGLNVEQDFSISQEQGQEQEQEQGQGQEQGQEQEQEQVQEQEQEQE